MEQLQSRRRSKLCSLVKNVLMIVASVIDPDPAAGKEIIKATA
jgi:hypothetical protein